VNNECHPIDIEAVLLEISVDGKVTSNPFGPCVKADVCHRLDGRVTRGRLPFVQHRSFASKLVTKL
jgi:hypothetical protein